MNLINCIIVEDEAPSSEELLYILNNFKDFQVDEVCRDGEEALKSIIKHCPKVVFLDINIPVINGIELANKIIEFNRNINIVFTTSYEGHALKAFELEAIDYILKPFDEVRIAKTILKLRDKISKQFMKSENLSQRLVELFQKLDKEDRMLKRIPCQEDDKILLINVDDICYLYVEDDKTFVKTSIKSYPTKHTLSDLENKTDFFRCHKSYLVNTEKIIELSPWFNGTYRLLINDEESSELPLSRSNVKRLKSLLDI